MFRIWPSWPGSVAAARLSAYRLGGTVNTFAPDAMAFVHRSSKWMITTDIDWSGGDSRQSIHDNLKWQRNVQNTFSVMLGRPGSYYNFPDPGLENHAWAYWGKNFWRLLQIKGRYDPDFVFNPPRNQGIFP
jgi:hypothetical protein